jgi:hypothetical protein
MQLETQYRHTKLGRCVHSWSPKIWSKLAQFTWQQNHSCILHTGVLSLASLFLHKKFYNIVAYMPHARKVEPQNQLLHNLFLHYGSVNTLPRRRTTSPQQYWLGVTWTVLGVIFPTQQYNRVFCTWSVWRLYNGTLVISSFSSASRWELSW